VVAVASPSSDVPYLYLAAIAIAGLLAVAIGGVFVLRVQVRARTRRLEYANRALAESETKYRELVELANSIILRWSRDGRITFLNEFGLRFFGFAADEIVGRHVMDTIVPATDAEGSDLAQLMSRITADPASFEQNVNENVRCDGTRVWIAWTNRVVRDEQGQVAEILSVGTDITERRRTEEALEQSRTQLSLVLNNVSDVVFAIAVEVDDGFRFASVNRRFLEITGLAEDQIVGVSARDVIPAAAHALVFDKYREAIESGLPAHWEEVSEYPTGKKIGAVTVVPVMDALGVCTQLVGMVHDITERHLADEAIRQLNVSLEKRVEERTAELAVAKDRAEAADLIKSAFLATMSHELRTPLNSIIGFTGTVLQGLAGPLNDEQRKQLEMVRDSARHLLALINDVLDISKIEAGQLEVSHEPFDLRASVMKIAGIVKPMADKKGLELRVSIAPEIDSLVSDPRRVEQVLLNLLNNAIKFTEHGAVSLTAEIAASGSEAQDSEIHIAVTDTGIGIKAEDLGMLFQPFRQIDSGISRQHEGTGLGLAICQRLAELLGGRVEAASEWGRGSTFTLVLPAQRRGES
jgi:PAS domain S-box-containing protein